MPESLAEGWNPVLVSVGVLALLSVCWFVVKAVARQAPSGRADRLYDRFDPYVQAVRAWLLSAPLTFVYVATWTITSILAQGGPEWLADLTSQLNSTSLWQIGQDPTRVLFTSGFLVAENGLGYWAYVIVYALIVARLEQRIGSARWVLVAVSSHWLGSLLTVTVEHWAIDSGRAPASLALATDVGVSYVMVGSCAGYALLVGRTWRPWYVAALIAGIVAPLFVSGTVWDLGHFLAGLVGLVVTAIALRFGTRAPLRFGQLVEASQPRPLPTFNAAPS